MKIFLQVLTFFCSGLIASLAMSQSIQLSDGTGILPNGKDIYIWGDTSIGTATHGIHIKNISTNTINVKCKKIEDSLISGTICTMCFGINCYASGTYITPKQDTLIPNATDTTFSGHYNPKGHLGESIVIFVFFNVANVNDSAWLVVHFNATAVGVNNLFAMNTEISNPYPNPATNFTSINYTLPNTMDKAMFVLTNITGSEVKKIEITNKGKLNINSGDLNNGVYFCSFFINDKLIQTKKLIIQH